MTEFRVSRRNLPYQIMVLKEIARRSLSSKNYSKFRKYSLETKLIKNHSYYNPGSWVTGTHYSYPRKITLRTTDGNLLSKIAISVFIHEICHMVWKYDRRIVRERSKSHAKAFKNLEKRLKDKYKSEIEPNLTQIIEECKSKTVKRYEKLNQRAKEQQKKVAQKSTTEYKLDKVNKLIKSWETKKKRAETHLKKLNRKKRLYNTLIAKKSAF